MQLKNDSHIFMGMEKDMDVAKHKAEYLSDAYNIRINPREDNTLLGITNERGPLYKSSYSGKYVGHVVADNEYIVLFLTSSNVIKKVTVNQGNTTTTYESTNRLPVLAEGETQLSDKDVILRIKISDYSYKFLFIGNLNFNRDYPIEGVYRYESSKIRKIYWIDGYNQPRMINIEKDYMPLEDPDSVSTKFDFILTLKLEEEVEIIKCIGGTFAPGVIQYAFSYFYLNGLESNIFLTTPLHYIGLENTKTVSPEGKSGDAFEINLSNLETKFDYVRIYSIHRTSWNATPECKIVADVKIDKLSDELTYIDYGNSGSIVSPTEMYYIGGLVITPSTLAFKDATLFLANYKMDMNVLRDANITSQFNFTPASDYSYGPDTYDTIEEYNDYQSYIVPKFKNGEHYLFGILVLDKYGRWSDPLLLDEKTIPDIPYCHTSKVDCTVTGLPSTAVKARGVCIYPTTEQRKILASGVINPTLYQLDNLSLNHKVFQSSWFFRPQHQYTNVGYQFENNTSIFRLGADSITDHLNTAAPELTVEIEGGGYNDVNTNFMISYDIVDFYSPDAEFDYLADSTNSLYELSYIGDVYVDMQSPFDTVNIQQLRLDAASEYNNAICPINRDSGITERLFMHTYMDDSQMKYKYYFIYPWTSSGSFTTPKTSNDYTDSFGTPFDSLDSNKMLRWVNGYTVFAETPVSLTECIYKSYLEENGDSSLEFNGNYYLGQVETLLQTANIDKYAKNGIEPPDDTWYSDFSEKRIVEMKYKTCSHLALSLNKPLYYNTYTNPPTPSGRTPITVIGFYHYSSSSTDVSDLKFIIKSYMRDIYGQFNTLGQDMSCCFIDEDLLHSILNYGDKYVIGELHGIFYLFKVNIYTKTTDNGIMMLDVGLQTIEGTNLANTYVWSGDVNIIMLAYDALGNMHGYPTPQEWITNYSGQYVLEDGKLTMWYENNEDPQNDPDVPVTDLGVLIPEQLYSPNYNRLILTDLVNKNPVPLLDDVYWIPASTVPSKVTAGSATITFDIGDTWVLNYYCIKTYPFTREDDNSITEIIKFECPTRTNLMGRYSTTTIPPSIPEVNREKFSLINLVYSNLNNFFTYKKIKETETVLNETVNSMTWCLENIPNADIDTNTSISLLNNYMFDEKITTLVTNRLNFYAFHPSSISKISFNPRVELSPSDNIPIELGTSKKMYGSDTLINNVGTTNKKAVIVTDAGIFFIDDSRRGLYLLSGDERISNISDTKNFASWFNTQNWLSQSRLFYDDVNSDLYIVGENDCLVFNAYMQEFISFMSYENIPTMFNVGYNFYAFDWYYDRTNLDDNYTSLYHMFNGNYNEFFGIYKPVHILFVSNPDSQLDKIFSTIESRMDVHFGSTLQTNKFFDYVRVWNEYQDSGDTSIATSPYNRPYQNTTSKKKFRIWRTDFPRNLNSVDRMRNTWTNIKFGFNAPVLQHGTVSNLTNTLNPNIAKYYEDIQGHNIDVSNIAQPVAPKNVRANNNSEDTSWYETMKMLLHDINVTYFIL